MNLEHELSALPSKDQISIGAALLLNNLPEDGSCQEVYLGNESEEILVRISYGKIPDGLGTLAIAIAYTKIKEE